MRTGIELGIRGKPLAVPIATGRCSTARTKAAPRRERGRTVHENALAGPGREEVDILETQAALFISGLAAGILLHRMLIAAVLFRSPSSRCDYCEWSRWKKKSRHRIP